MNNPLKAGGDAVATKVAENAHSLGVKFLHFFDTKDPTKITLLLASTEMILRPLITLANKNEDKEKRETAAKTEFALQLVVIPVILVIPTIFKQIGKVFKKPGATPKQLEAAGAFFSFLGLFTCNIVIPPATKWLMNIYDKKFKKPDAKSLDKPNEIKKVFDIESKAPELNPALAINPVQKPQSPSKPYNQASRLLSVYSNMGLNK